jgi:hypothetical protein
MASPGGLLGVRAGGSLWPGRLAYRPRRHRHLPINRPGRTLYLTLKPLYQKGFGGNWGGVRYTRSCQSASE